MGKYNQMLTIDRFLDKVCVQMSSCWLWTGAKSKKGYGRFWWSNRLGMAHRFSYEYFVSCPIPVGYELDHSCRNHSCVNPDHVRPLTPQIHKLQPDSIAVIRAQRVYCTHGHTYTYWYNTGRQCRECHKLWKQQRRRKDKELSA